MNLETKLRNARIMARTLDEDTDKSAAADRKLYPQGGYISSETVALARRAADAWWTVSELEAAREAAEDAATEGES